MKRKVSTWRLIDGTSMNGYSVGFTSYVTGYDGKGRDMMTLAESVAPIEFYELETGEIRIRSTDSPIIHLFFDKVVAIGEHGEFEDESTEGEADEDQATDIVDKNSGLRPVD
jgi:hypothetical protein